nr:hypothetical protein CFP56_32215 [Quercus suber]
MFLTFPFGLLHTFFTRPHRCKNGVEWQPATSRGKQAADATAPLDVRRGDDSADRLVAGGGVPGPYRPCRSGLRSARPVC